MVWSNEALVYENKLYKAVKQVLMDLAKEVADNLDKLVVDEKGVLVEIPKFDLFFDRKRAINKMVNATIPIMKETLQHFGERGIKEAQDAKPK